VGERERRGQKMLMNIKEDHCIGYIHAGREQENFMGRSQLKKNLVF
jgi:hypothetical protein